MYLHLFCNSAYMTVLLELLTVLLEYLDLTLQIFSNKSGDEGRDISQIYHRLDLLGQANLGVYI